MIIRTTGSHFFSVPLKMFYGSNSHKFFHSLWHTSKLDFAVCISVLRHVQGHNLSSIFFFLLPKLFIISRWVTFSTDLPEISLSYPLWSLPKRVWLSGDLPAPSFHFFFPYWDAWEDVCAWSWTVVQIVLQGGLLTCMW